MAGVKIQMTLEDTGATIKKRTDETRQLNGELTKTTKLAQQAISPKAAGFRAAGQEGTEYGQARGSAGATGAAGRDFANQAQGLGGLVRLYATYAANVFAVSAAFSALREAMNTDMMIRGLDQLGAASGVALGGLAKQFSAASDGAISMRESMEATAKAITSGLSQQQFMDLGKVAKGASQALGVNMSDAVSRLTRGITKLEPELLDELGIFTKVGKATEDYARSVGKSANSLTDFERRQAFANAVLEEGKKKFGEIAMQANPYDQLLASLKNVAQEILSVVNTVIAPIAKLLADNTGLIGAAIAAAALKITNQALPALASWQAGLKDAAESAATRAKEINESFGGAWVARQEARENIPKLDKEIEASATRLEKIEVNRVRNAAGLTAASAGYEKSSKTLLLIKKQEALTEQELSKLSAARTRAEGVGTAAAAKQVAAITARLDLEKQYNAEVAKGVGLAAARQESYGRIQNRSEQVMFGSGDWQREQISRTEAARAARLNLLSGVAGRVQESGLAELKSFFADVNANQDLANRGFDKFRTKATGALIGVASAARIAGAAFLNFISGPLQIAILAFTVADMLFSKNAKSMGEFTSAVDLNTESVKTSENVLTKYGDVMTTESINAKANAFTSLKDSITSMTNALSQADAEASGFDKFIDGFKSIIDKDLKSTFTRSLAANLVSSIEQLPEDEAKEALKSKILTITGAANLSLQGLNDALDKVSSTKIVGVGKALAQEMATAGKALKDAQAYTQDIVQNEKALNDSLLSMSKGLAKLSDYDKTVEQISKNIAGLGRAFQNPISAADTFNKILSGDINTSILGLDASLKTLETSRAFAGLSNEAKALNQELKNIKQSRAGLSNIQTPSFGRTRMTVAGSSYETDREISGLLRRRESEIQTSLNNIAQKQRALLAEQVELTAKAAEKVADLQIQSFQAKLQGIGIQGSLDRFSKLPFKTVETAEAIGAAERSLIQAQLSQTTATNNLTLAMEASRLAQEEATRAYLSGQQQEALARGDTDTAKRIGLELARSSRGIIDYKELQRIISSGDAASAMRNPYLSEAAKSAMQGNALARAEAGRQTQASLITQRQEKISIAFKKVNEDLDDLTKVLSSNLEIARGGETPNLELITSLQTNIDRIAKERSSGEKNFYEQIINAAGVTGTVSQSQIDEASRQYSRQISTQTLETGTRATTTAQNVSKQTQEVLKSLGEQYSLETQSRDLALQSLSIHEQDLAKMKEQGLITETSYATQSQAIALSRINLELQTKLVQLDREKLTVMTSIDKLINTEGQTDTAKEQLKGLKTSIDAYYTSAITGAKGLAEAQKRNSELMTDEQARIANFNKFGENLFVGFGDAIVGFAETGKWSFGDMVNSMLADLLRLELKMQMMRLYEQAGGGSGLTGILTSIGSAIFGGPAAAMGPVEGLQALPGSFDQFLVPSAQGNGFNNTGLMQFAKGGAFTNSVVSTPTLFKFAQGTGLMGEAGPEAIMPLKRDATGTLGVRANVAAPSVDVVVNNYSGERAQTNETVDSRGNRKIEVLIGEMVATEMQRPNSPVQNTMKNTYGVAPVLTRR